MKGLRPLGVEYLSGPPIGSMEYDMMPMPVRHGFLRSMTGPANGYIHGLKSLDVQAIPTQTQKKRQHGHAA